jgi:hypothetical protein
MAIANITNNILTDSGVATSALQIALNGTGFVKIVGTTISYDNSTYLTTSAAASTYVALTGNQTIAGVKTFSNNSKFDGALILKNNVSSSLAGYVGLSALSFSGNKGINIDFDTYSIGFYFNGTLPYNYTFPNANGTVALTSDIPDVSGYVTLITAQTITGAKTFTSALNGTSATFSSSIGTTALNMNNMTSLGSISGGSIYLPSTAVINFRSANGATGYGSIAADTSSNLIFNNNVGIGMTPDVNLQVKAISGNNTTFRIGPSASGFELNQDNGGYTLCTVKNIYGTTSNLAELSLQSGFITFKTGTSLTTALTIASTGAATFTGSVTATSFFESSDSRLKTLIQDNYQTKGIASITPKLYTKNGKVELGYYAQDFVGVLDSAVSKGSDDMLSLSYREVLVAKVYALEQEIKELKGRKFNISTTKLK